MFCQLQSLAWFKGRTVAYSHRFLLLCEVRTYLLECEGEWYTKGLCSILIMNWSIYHQKTAIEQLRKHDSSPQ
jgi:hypothetical protein